MTLTLVVQTGNTHLNNRGGESYRAQLFWHLTLLCRKHNTLLPLNTTQRTNCDITIQHDTIISWWRHAFDVTGPLYGESMVSDGFPSQRVGNTELCCFLWLTNCWKKNVGLLVIWNAFVFIWRHCNVAWVGHIFYVRCGRTVYRSGNPWELKAITQFVKKQNKHIWPGWYGLVCLCTAPRHCAHIIACLLWVTSCI